MLVVQTYVIKSFSCAQQVLILDVMMDSQVENSCFVLYYVGCDGQINKPNSSHLSQLARMSGSIILILNLKHHIFRGHILLIFYNRHLHVLFNIRVLLIISIKLLYHRAYPNKSVLINIDTQTILFSKQSNQKTIKISLITYYLTWRISEHLFVFNMT